MRRLTISQVLLAVLGLALCGTASAQERVHFDQANPPFMFANAGAPAGLYPALFKEAFSRMNVKVELDALPWKRALADTDAGLAGTGGLYKTPERAQKYDFSAPFYEERIAVYTLAGGLQYTKLSDLAGKTVGVVRGWSYGDAFDAAVRAATLKAEEADDDATNLKKLALRRVDAVVAIVEAGDAGVAALHLGDKVKRAETLLASNPVHLAFARSANKAKVLAAFDQTMSAMRKDGSFEAILKKSL